MTDHMITPTDLVELGRNLANPTIPGIVREIDGIGIMIRYHGTGYWTIEEWDQNGSTRETDAASDLVVSDAIAEWNAYASCAAPTP